MPFFRKEGSKEGRKSPFGGRKRPLVWNKRLFVWERRGREGDVGALWLLGLAFWWEKKAFTAMEKES